MFIYSVAQNGNRLYLFPSFGRHREQNRLHSFVKTYNETGIIKDDRIHVVNYRHLLAGELEACQRMIPHLAYAQTERILHLLRRHSAFAPRSESSAKINLEWQLYCLQYPCKHKIETTWDMRVLEIALSLVN